MSGNLLKALRTYGAWVFMLRSRQGFENYFSPQNMMSWVWHSIVSAGVARDRFGIGGVHIYSHYSQNNLWPGMFLLVRISSIVQIDLLIFFSIIKNSTHVTMCVMNTFS